MQFMYNQIYFSYFKINIIVQYNILFIKEKDWINLYKYTQRTI